MINGTLADTVYRCINSEEDGLTFAQLVKKLIKRLSITGITRGLEEIVRDRYVYYRYDQEPTRSVKDEPALRYFVKDQGFVGDEDEPDESEVSINLRDNIVEAIENMPSIQEGSIKGVWQIFERFEENSSFEEIEYALAVLQEDGVITFCIDENGHTWFALESQHEYTVIAMQIYSTTSYWFQVKAGSPEAAADKVKFHSTIDRTPEFEPTGVIAGWIPIMAVDRRKPFPIERI